MVAMTNGAQAIATGDYRGDAWKDFIHTGPETLAGRWLRTFWQPILRSSDLPNGRAKPIQIMSEQFTLYRGEGGDAHLLAFRCAHRGTQLSTGWVEGDAIRCFYHGWKYDGSGQCIEQPAEPEPFCDKIRVRSYPVEEYLGLIFACLGEDQPPPLPRYPEFDDEARGTLAVTSGSTPCNLFNLIDNDPIHIYFVHQNFNAAQGRADIPRLHCEETDYGFVTWAMDSRETWAYHIHMPAVVHGRSDGGAQSQSGGGAGEALQWRVPVNDEATVSFRIYRLFVGSEDAAQARQARSAQSNRAARVNEVGQQILRGELRIQDVDDPTVLFNVQDYIAVVGQGVMTDLTIQHLGPSDAPVSMLRTLWGREIRALHEGRPLKQWKHPPEALEVSTERRMKVAASVQS